MKKFLPLLLLLPLCLTSRFAAADVIYEYEGAAFSEVLVGSAFALGDSVSGTIRFDSIGDTTPDVSLSVTSSGNPSLPFTIAALDVAYGGTWADTDGDLVLDDPFTNGYAILLSANVVSDLLVDEILISDIGDQASIDNDTMNFAIAHAASSGFSTGTFTAVPEPNGSLLMLAVVAVLRVRRRKSRCRTALLSQHI